MEQQANDKITYMTSLQKCLNMLEGEGYTDQYKVNDDKLYNLTNDQSYGAQEVSIVNFYRFEGPSNPDDMSILYAVETVDGRKGTLVDAYGLYADDNTGRFLQQVKTHKKV